MMQFRLFSKQASSSSQASTPAIPNQTLLQLRILSFNIRYATRRPFAHEKPWKDRFPRLINQLLHETRFTDGACSNDASESSPPPAASIICLQEVLNTQLMDIMNILNRVEGRSGSNEAPTNRPLWAHVGVGRDDGKTLGEYSPIIYPINIFSLLHCETIWLSPTPEKPSKGWDAGSIRIITVAVLECKSTGQRILASSTHLDNAGSKSRKHSVEIILKTLKRVQHDWTTKGNLPVFLAGDFNSFPDQEAYQLMAQSDYMYDLRQFVDSGKRYNDGNTFTGFEPEKDKDEQGRIDFIWLGPKDSVCSPGKADESLDTATDESQQLSWVVDGYAVLPNVLDDGLYLSDHRCVVGDVRLLR